MVENISGICAVLSLESVEGGISGQLEQVVKDGMYRLCCVAFCLGNVYMDSLVSPGKDLIHIAGATVCLPLLGSNCAEFVFFFFGQHTGGDIAGLTQLFGTERVPVVETNVVKLCSGHNLTGSGGIAMDNQEAVTLEQSSVIVALSALVASANYVADLQIANDICDFAVCRTLDTAAPSIFKPDCLIILCDIGAVGRGGAIGVDTGIKDQTNKAVDSLAFVSSYCNVDASHLIEPRQNLICIGAADSGEIVIGGLDLCEDVLFGIAQNILGNVTGAAKDVIDVLEGSGGTENNVIFERQLLCGCVVKGVLKVQSFSHIGKAAIQPSCKLFVGVKGQIYPDLLIDGNAASILYVEQEFVVALIDGCHIEAELTTTHHNYITGMEITDIGKLALLISGNAYTCIVHQHVILLFCTFSGHIHQRIVVTECGVNIGACHIFEAGLHNRCERGIIGAVCDDINADLLIDFTDKGSVYLDPAAILGIQSFQSGGCQGTQQNVACGGGIAGGCIVLSQGGAICGIESADSAIYIGVSLAGTQTDKHIVGKCSLQTCGAGDSFHPLVGGEGCVMVVA